MRVVDKAQNSNHILRQIMNFIMISSSLQYNRREVGQELQCYPHSLTFTTKRYYSRS
jgi:hypothetical protein